MRSPSKLNLYLKVTGKRPDGYHELETLFLPLREPADEVEIAFDAASGIRVDGGPLLPRDLDNLAGRAADAYARAAGIVPAWSIRLEKRIPVAAGMGGGSSNAATVLLALNERYGKLSPAELAAAALTIGADVPYFLDPRPAVARGVGEELTPVPGEFAPLHLVVANPRFPVSARWAYRNLDPARIGPSPAGELEALLAALRRGDAEAIGRNLRNDLAHAAFAKFPLLELIRRRMLECGAAGAAMTGSGPTLFAVTATPELRRQVAEGLAAAFSPETLTIFEAAV